MNRAATLAMLVALIIGSNYALFALPNVKLMDMLVFLAGFWLGPVYGAAAGALSWLGYGTVNPLGFNLITLATVVPMEMLYGVLGGLLRKRAAPNPLDMAWSFGLVALGTTLLYDLVTNAVTGAIWYNSVVVGIVAGIFPFSVLHVLSNLLLFSVVAPVVVIEADRSFFKGVRQLA
jgi:hypothetical protein